ncbi:MAG: hypothetical protein J1E04_02830 [Alistipes sp.]|nr:hypothetical protein [Alistipes sp.]
MNESNSVQQRRVSFVALLFFVLFMSAAVILMVAAAVMWLAGLLGSIALSCLIFGGVAAITAFIIWLASVRISIQIMHEWLGTVYDTSRMAKSGYEYVKSWIALLFE